MIMLPVRRAPAVLLACVVAFVVLDAAAMALYPGGTWWDPTTHGVRFWQNFLCDLEWNPALNGEPNPVGSRLAQTAMLVLVAGFVPFWWIAARLFPARRVLGAAVRVLGLTSVAGMVAVVLMPSDRFGALHGAAVVLAGLPGLSAALLAAAGMLLPDAAKPARIAGALGAAMLLFALLDHPLRPHHDPRRPGPAPPARRSEARGPPPPRLDVPRRPPRPHLTPVIPPRSHSRSPSVFACFPPGDAQRLSHPAQPRPPGPETPR